MPETPQGETHASPPAGRKRDAFKGEVLGKNTTLRESTIAAMPGQPGTDEKALHPHVAINGVTYEWEPGQEGGIPEEALTIWRRYLEANT